MPMDLPDEVNTLQARNQRVKEAEARLRAGKTGRVIINEEFVEIVKNFKKDPQKELEAQFLAGRLTIPQYFTLTLAIKNKRK